jgi:hypothetical protein
MPKSLDLYRQRYIQAVRTVMAEQNIETYKDIAPKIKSTTQTLSAIIQKRQYPTVQHGIDLCTKYRFSANWLFLGIGQERLSEQATLEKIIKAIQKL